MDKDVLVSIDERELANITGGILNMILPALLGGALSGNKGGGGSNILAGLGGKRDSTPAREVASTPTAAASTPTAAATTPTEGASTGGPNLGGLGFMNLASLFNFGGQTV